MSTANQQHAYGTLVFTAEDGFLFGAEQVTGYSLYLGSQPLATSITATLRQFNLPTTVAPGEWPARLGGASLSILAKDAIGRGEGNDAHLAELAEAV